MKTKKTNRDEIRSSTMCIMVTKDEKLAIDRAAFKSGMTLSSYARHVLLERARKG